MREGDPHIDLLDVPIDVHAHGASLFIEVYPVAADDDAPRLLVDRGGRKPNRFQCSFPFPGVFRGERPVERAVEKQLGKSKRLSAFTPLRIKLSRTDILFAG